MATDTEHELRHFLQTEAARAEPAGDLPDRLLLAVGGRSPKTSASRRWRSSRVLVPLGVAVLTAVVVFGVAWARARTQSAASEPSPAPTATATATATGNHARAIAFVDDLIGKTVVLPGASEVDRAPVAAVRNPPGVPVTKDFVERKRWWVAPGTVDQAAAYLRAHTPAGMLIGITQSSQSPRVETTGFIPRDFGPATAGVDSPLGLTLTVGASSPGQIAVLADVQASWDPDRTTAETIPKEVSSVDIVLLRSDRVHPYQSTQGAAVARSLGVMINRLAPAAPGVYSCPADRGYQDRMTFHTPGKPDVDTVVSVQGCGFIDISVGGVSQPGVRGGGLLDLAVLKALDLPASFNK